MIALLYFGCLMLQQSQKMLSDMRYNVSSDNSFVPLLSEEMTGDGFQTVKRKWNNTGYGEGRVRPFMDSSSTDKLNLIFNELQVIRGNLEQMSRNVLNFQQSYRLVNNKLSEVIEVTNKNTNILKTLEYKSIDLEARYRRNNLLFWGLLENPNENCFQIIRDFVHRHLDLDAGTWPAPIIWGLVELDNGILRDRS